VAPAPQQTYTVRRFQPQDAPGVARAFYQTWGYHYIFPAVYVPHRLTELNASNAYISIVATAQDGEIVGHYALSPVPGAPIADGCAAIVVPAHRGRGLLERMRAEMEAEAARLGFAAYYTEPVTTHGRTQSESAKFGAQLCAIVLGGDPATFVPKAMSYTGAGQRQSYTVYFKPLRPREPRSVYSPAKHRDVVTKIYANLQLPVVMREGIPANGEGNVRVEVVRAEGFASIDVLAAGVSTLDRITQAVSDLRKLERIGAIYANLPLEDAGTPALCEGLELLGFFFSGVIPWAMEGRDVLRMQLPLTPIDLSQVTIVGQFGAELKAYIERQIRAL
jgi:GNAT superfamily N-acetyltransferase